jgi:hypothetical protein
VDVPAEEYVDISTDEEGDDDAPVVNEVAGVLLALTVVPAAASLRTSAILSPPLSPGTDDSATGCPFTYTEPSATPEAATEYVVPATTTPVDPASIVLPPTTYGCTEWTYSASWESVIVAVANTATNEGAVVKCAASSDPVTVAVERNCSNDDMTTSGLEVS